ncbi:50S ribosomal protein L29 [Cytophagales bacterium LB-30]|uniref:Large ribosomal subunit protein uL29 n=1 Tax=Shiella aurantiaca TaxID=3058365 RepID=A0ABT8F7F5_9BACT|nr:50S ribosomal protein L29 [Shiella aurantiaca]MDN4166328.1 50S ribosomal protein L29 [Shiella aurantiaca]
MKMSEIKSLSLEDIKSKIVSEKEAIRKLQFAHAISPIENPMKIREARKVIARLETELSARNNA